MGKIMKYCGSCEEGFAERFTFCPDCGGGLQAVEMNPVGKEVPAEVPAPEAPAFIAEAANEIKMAEQAAVLEFAGEPEAMVEPAVETDILIESAAPDTVPSIEVPETMPSIHVEETPAQPAAEPAYAGYYRSQEVNADQPRRKPITTGALRDDGDYYVTVIQETNVKQRNMLLLGSTIFVLSAAIVSWGVSLFQKELSVGSIGDEQSLAYLIDSVPMPVDEEEQKKDKDKGGGGGGGGKNEPDPVNEGDLPNQSRTPTRPPDPKVFRSDNFELKTPPPQTEGDRKFEQKYGQWGDPNSRFGKLSSGPGTGGGMGTGTGTGAGSGSGTGTGTGTGSGSGGGLGDGDGDGTGPGGGGPPARVVGPSTALRIISKPRPGYTDEARKNQIQGTVLLRVTFLASGQIGPISTVKGLPNGLTEKAIAAARSIQFEPRKDGGIPKSVTRVIEYTFTIY